VIAYLSYVQGNPKRRVTRQFEEFVSVHERRNIGDLLGKIKDKYGATSIGLGRAGMMAPPDWTMARRHSSPRYTTDWDEVLLV
jgi:DNA polymerase V